MSKREPAASRTEKAAAIQAQQASKERNRRLLIVLAVVLVLSAIVAAGVVFSGGSKPAASAGDLDPRASGTALVIGNDPGAATKVVIYEDFLCPYCREFEAVSRDFLRLNAKEGRVVVEYRPFKLLPMDYSTLALTAWAAVLKDGTAAQALKFHDLLFDNQPDERSSDQVGIDDIVALAEKAGVKDPEVLAAMREPDPEFVTAAGATATKAGVEGTPTIFVNGEQLQGSVTEMADELERLIAQG